MRDDAPSQATIFRRTAQLQQGRQSTVAEQLYGLHAWIIMYRTR